MILEHFCRWEKYIFATVMIILCLFEFCLKQQETILTAVRFAVLFSQEETILDVIKEININNQILVCFYFLGTFCRMIYFHISPHPCLGLSLTLVSSIKQRPQHTVSSFNKNNFLISDQNKSYLIFLTLNLFVSKVKYPPFFKKNHLTLKFLARTSFLTGNEYRLKCRVFNIELDQILSKPRHNHISIFPQPKLSLTQ